MSAVSELRWPLTARESELGALAEAWGLRRVRGVVVAGPAGVGKTRLAEEFLAGAVGERVRAARSTASAAAATVPLGAIAHLIPQGVDLSDPVKGFAQVARVLAGPDRQRRWAVMVDDLHHLDAASAVLLQQLADAGVVRLIATVRTGEPLADAVGALLAGDAVHRIDLDPFTPAQVEAVLQATLAGPVTRRTVHQLATASGGNALYLRELVVGALETSRLTWDGEIWQLAQDPSGTSTPRLAELIAARLDGVGPAGRRVLDLLSVCEPVSLSDAEAEAGSMETLTELESSGLVRVYAQRRRITVALAHPLYGEQLRGRLAVLHRRQLLLAQAERVRGRGGRRREDALHVAAWQLAATGTADPDLLLQAAAQARYAHDYRKTITLIEALPESARTTRTRLMLGEVLFEDADPQRANQVLADADAHAKGEGEVIAVTMARTFNLFWGAGRSDEAFALNDASRSRVDSDAGQRMLRYNEGSMRIVSGEPTLGLSLMQDLGDDIRDAPDPVAWLIGATMKPIGLAIIGKTAQAIAFAEHAHTAHRAASESTLYLHPAAQLIPLSYALRRHGQLRQARAVGERGYAELTAADIPVVRMWTAINLGETELLSGHPASSRRWYAEAAAQARVTHNIRALNPALNGLAACAALLGDLGAAQQAIAEAKTHPGIGFFFDLEYRARAWSAAACGELESARTLLQEGAAAARTGDNLPAEAFLLTDVARLGGARQVADRLAELAAMSEGAFVPACAALATALAADDADALVACARELESIGADLMAADAAQAAVAAYLKAGRSRKAAAAGQLAQASAACCEGARTPLLATAGQAAALTSRERDVALLAASGASSKDVAGILHLSVRTVENHLQHAYTKLGVTTRRELTQALSGRPLI